MRYCPLFGRDVTDAKAGFHRPPWRRMLLLLAMSVIVAGCIPVATVSLSGSGRVLADRGGVCRTPQAEMAFDLPAELELIVRADINSGYDVSGYQMRVHLSDAGEYTQKNRERTTPRPTIYLLSSTAVIIDGGQMVPMNGLESYGPTEKDTVRFGGGRVKAEADAAEQGKNLLKVSLGSRVYWSYDIPAFSGLSTRIALPALLVNGKRFDIAPVTLRKSMSYNGLCAH